MPVSIPFSDQPFAFLETLFGEVPPEMALLLWTLHDKRSHWCTSLEEAAEVGTKLGHSEDCYVGMGLRLRSFAALAGAKERGSARECKALGGLWADVDYQDGIRTKRGVFLSAREALGWLDGLPLRPTMVVDSGGGYHAYWCFKELWAFETPQEHMDAEVLCIRWRETLKNWAAQADRTIDSVSDLARVMRLPNTYNHKIPEQPRFCQLERHEPDIRYEPEAFEKFLLSFDVHIKDLPANARYDFILSSSAMPPMDKWEALKALDPRVEASFQYARRDLKDASPSGYDLSLAAFAVQAHWTNQEIVNLLIACRREHGEDLKLRPAYYANTLETARQNARYTQALDDLAVLPTTPVPPPSAPVVGVEEDPTMAAPGHDVPLAEAPLVDGGNPVENPHNAQRLDILQAIMGFRIKRLTKYAAYDPVYTLETSAGTIDLGDVSNLITQRAFRNKVAALTGHLIPTLSKEKWDKVAQLLLNLCVEVSIGEENSAAGRIEDWLTGYLEQWPPQDWDETAPDASEVGEGLFASRVPFLKGQHLYIFLNSLRDWLFRVRAESVEARTLAVLLREVGWEPHVVNIKTTNGRSTRAVWRRIQYARVPEEV